MKTVISTPNAPGAIGPYSQGYAFGDLVITSGHPLDLLSRVRAVVLNGRLLSGAG